MCGNVGVPEGGCWNSVLQPKMKRSENRYWNSGAGALLFWSPCNRNCRETTCCVSQGPHSKERTQFMTQSPALSHCHQSLYKHHKPNSDGWLIHFADKGNCHCFIICSRLESRGLPVPTYVITQACIPCLWRSSYVYNASSVFCSTNTSCRWV